MTILRFSDAFADAWDEQRARELALLAVQSAPKHALIVASAAQILGRCGFMHEATQLRLRADELRGTNEEGVLAIPELENWEPSDLTDPIIFARHFLAARFIRPHHAATWVGVCDDEISPSFVYETSLDLDVEQTASLEAEFYEALAGKHFAAEQEGRVLITFASRSEEGTDANIVE